MRVRDGFFDGEKGNEAAPRLCHKLGREYRAKSWNMRLGKAAAELMSDAGKYAEAAGVSKVSAPDWTWSAQDFTSYWMMRISFVACRLTALAVLHGVRSSMKAHESSN